MGIHSSEICADRLRACVMAVYRDLTFMGLLGYTPGNCRDAELIPAPCIWPPTLAVLCHGLFKSVT